MLNINIDMQYFNWLLIYFNINYFLNYKIQILCCFLGINSLLIFNNNKIKLVQKLILNIQILIFFILLIFLILRWYLLLTFTWIELYDLVNWQNNKLILFLNTFSINYLGEILLFLALFTGIICLFLSSDKNLLNQEYYFIFFNLFIIATLIMISTKNLLIMFIGFELMAFPTLFFCWKISYTKKIDFALKTLLYWTIGGSFITLTLLLYIFIVKEYSTYNIYWQNITLIEKNILSIIIFLSLGSKLPIFPFHYWLTKVHVEASASFSIYLSGFLVKAALYCLIKILIFLPSTVYNYFFILLILIGIIESSLKFWLQTDIKKLIAYATIQEMNIIFIFFLFKNFFINISFLLFTAMHGLFSTIMFFIVEVIQKRTITRNIVELGGISIYFLTLNKYLWLIVLTFSGFPCTVKFIIEFYLFHILLDFATIGTSLIFILSLIFIIGIVAPISFAKNIFSIIYGEVRLIKFNFYDLTKKEKLIFTILNHCLLLLSIIIFIM